MISNEGGVEPLWAHDGSALYYRNGNRMMVVSFTVTPVFATVAPEVLVEGAFALSAPGYPYYDIHPDGRRFVMIQSTESGSQRSQQIHLVLNWFEELKERAPVR